MVVGRRGGGGGEWVDEWVGGWVDIYMHINLGSTGLNCMIFKKSWADWDKIRHKHFG